MLCAIGNEQVEGFLPKAPRGTAFVEHGIGEKEPECEWTPLEYIFADETVKAMMKDLIETPKLPNFCWKDITSRIQPSDHCSQVIALFSNSINFTVTPERR